MEVFRRFFKHMPTSYCLPPLLLRGSRRDFQLSHLLEATSIESTSEGERRLLNLVLPPWQRPEVWTSAQKARFIESVFLGLGCGYYVVNGQDWDRTGEALPMSGWLLDGQQRLTAIRDFIAGDVRIFGGIRWDDLDRLDKLRRFLRQPFPCFELDYTSDEDALKLLYERLNFGGTPHTGSDRDALR